MDVQPDLIERQVAVSDGAAYRKVGNNWYVYSLSTGETNRLSGVGDLIWERLAQGMPLRQIAGALSTQFEMPVAQVEQDVCRFVQGLSHQGVVTIKGQPAPRRRPPDQATRWQPASVIPEVKQGQIPFRIDFELTYACNLACAYCYTSKEAPRSLSTSEVQAVIEQLIQAGTMFLCFTGGEPFIRPDTDEIIEYAHRRRVALLVLTNAMLITPARAALLARTSSVQVSLHGAQAATHDAFTGVPGSFERACRGIEQLAQAGANTYVIFNATHRNVREEDALRRRCDEWQVGFLLNVHLLPNVNGSLDPLQYRISDDDARDLIRRGRLSRVHSSCVAGLTKARISPAGDVYPCELVRRSFGNLRERTLDDIWRSAEFKTFRASAFFATPSACQGCEWRAHCRRCPALAELEDQDLSGPSQEACRIARLCSLAAREVEAA